MTVMTARPWWVKESIGTFTPIQALNIVSLRVLVTAPLSQEVEKITLDITSQSTLYTDAPRGIMLQRSGGLENSKFLKKSRETPFTKHKHRTHYLQRQRFNGVHFISKKVITYISSGWPLSVSMPLMTSLYIRHLSETQQAFLVT